MALYGSSEAAEIGITAAFVFLVIADLFGNSLVCLVVFKNRLMRIPLNYLLVNLALADMTVAVFIAIRYIFPLSLAHPKGNMGDAVCQLVMFMWVGAFVSAFSLVCIALERYLAVKFPYDKQKRITTTKVKRVIAVIWVLAVLCNMPLFLYARHDHVNEFCVVYWPNANSPQFHSLATAMLYGVLPITIIVYLYSKLLYKLWSCSTPCSTLAQQINLRHCKKTAQLLVTVSVVYVACWIPNLIIYVLSSFTFLQMYSSVYVASVVLVTLNSAINPVLYCWQSDRFRKNMLALLPFSCCSPRRSRVLPVNLETSTNTNKMASLTRAKRLPHESRGPTG